MPTATSYITTTGQSGGDVAWSNLSNADGEPDGAVATADTGGDKPNAIAFSHSATVPDGATVDAVRAVIRWADGDEQVELIDIAVALNGSQVGTLEEIPPQLAPDDVTITGTASTEDVNAGAGSLSFVDAQVNGSPIFIIDSIRIEVDYTGGRRSSRTFLFKEMVKSPIVRQC